MLKRIGVAIIVLLCLVMLMCAFNGCDNRQGMYYGKTATVSTINAQEGYVGFTDQHGDEWLWNCDTTTAPWSLDDAVVLVIYDNGTDYIFDDEIISITAEGLINNTVTK